MAKGIAEHIDALIKARIRPLEQDVALLKKRVERAEKFAEQQQDTLEKQDGELDDLFVRLHEWEA